jgi:hypothetical protein
MGAGIAAVIPIEIAPYRRLGHSNLELEYFSPKLLEFYSLDTESNCYTIKHELLLDNYKSFLAEFFDCIGETHDTQDFPQFNSYEAFKEFFDERERNMAAPFIYKHWSTFSILGGIFPEYWLFYNGSYKAYLEDYSTLLHFERTLNRAMSNPLANIIKFGIFG